MGKPEGKGPRGRARRWWVDNSEMDLGAMGWGRESSCEYDNEFSLSKKKWWKTVEWLHNW
jgi:hypothetical protein